MKKVSTDIAVYVYTYFGNQRPFQILEGKVVHKPIFPNTLTINGLSIPQKALFMEGNDFRVGLYYGDVYEIEGKNYHLFKVVREPSKTIKIVNPHQVSSVIKLSVESPGGKTTDVTIKRTGNPINDLDVARTKIRALQGTLADLKDLTGD